MDALALRGALRDSPVAQHAFTQITSALGVIQQRRGRNLSALEVLLKGWRSATQIDFQERGIAAVNRIIHRTCFSDGTLVPAGCNQLVREFLRTAEARRIRDEFARFPMEDRVRLRYPRPDDDPERQGNLILLKRHNSRTSEKGVLLIKYSEAVLWLPALYDFSKIATRYRLVLEPCWVGYQDWRFLLYLARDLEVVVSAPYPSDFEFIQGLNANLLPIALGAGDWVDPQTFRPAKRDQFDFDLVMVASWNPIKRHGLLLKALSALRKRGYRRIRFALVGYPSVWKREKIEKLLRHHGLEHDCTIFESIPHEEVADVVASSRASLLLSRKEGTNKAVFESLFCDTPVIVYRHHQGGINHANWPSDVAVLATEQELPDTIVHVLEHRDRFRPRKWAMANTGWPRSTERLEKTLCGLARRTGEPWSEGIAAKMNAPNLRYAEKGRYRDFAGEYRQLEALLRE